MRIKAIWIVACIQIVVSSAGQDRLTHIGGGARDPAAHQVVAFQSAPLKVRASAVSAAEAKLLFEAQIAVMYAVAENGDVVQTHRYRHLGGNNWDRERIGGEGSRINIMQHFGGQRYLARYGSTDSSMFVIDLDGGPYADDTTLRIRTEDTGQVFSYTSVLGAKKTVRVLRSVSEPSLRAPTYEDFVQAVKDGHAFDVLRDASVPCPECRGTGFVKARDQDGRLGLRKICPVCNARKTVIRRAWYRIASE